MSLKEPRYSVFDLIEILKGLQSNGSKTQMKIGENENAMKHLKMTLEEIQKHNDLAKSWDLGFSNAQEEFNQKLQDKINELLK